MSLISKEYSNQCTRRMKDILKPGDRVGCTKCPGTKRAFTFSHWDGQWMVSKSGIDDYHPCHVYSLNGKKFSFRDYKEEPQ